MRRVSCATVTGAYLGGCISIAMNCSALDIEAAWKFAMNAYSVMQTRMAPFLHAGQLRGLFRAKQVRQLDTFQNGKQCRKRRKRDTRESILGRIP
jgi:hypothetical protein